MTRQVGAAVTVVLLAVGLTGCGSGESEEQDVFAPTQTSAVAEEVVAAPDPRESLCGEGVTDVMAAFGTLQTALIDQGAAGIQVGLDVLSDGLVSFHQDLEAADELGTAGAVRSLVADIDTVKQVGWPAKVQWAGQVLDVIEGVVLDCQGLAPGAADQRRDAFLGS